MELHPHNVAPDRILRARWVLAWRTGAGGEQRAKARLVLQGFNDPDLLEGKLETSSPTLCRTARQTLLAIACNENWEKWVSDVATAFLYKATHKLANFGQSFLKMPARC